MSFASIVRALGKGPADAKARSGSVIPPVVYAGHDQGDQGNNTDSWQKVIGRLQQRRGSHVIGLIHRHQIPGEDWLEWYFDAVIGETHVEDFLSALDRVPGDGRLDLVLHSIGAFTPAFQQIARAIKAHKGETTVFVPFYAHDLATLIALGADRIVMGPGASLSYIEFEDLQAILREKGARRTHDFTIIRLPIERLFQNELRELVCELTHGGAHGENCPLGREMIGVTRSHADPILAARAKKMGLPVTTQAPDDVFKLVSACRAAPARDQGIKTAPRVTAMPTVPRAKLLPEIFGGWDERRDLAALPWRVPNLMRRATEVLHDSATEEEDDGGSSGVALENCDITVRPLIARMESSRNSRVICVIHQPGMESSSLDTVTTEDILTALHATPPDKPLDIILHTPGGYAFQTMQIASAIKAHKGPKTVFVPHFAMSGGTIIALAADQIVMAPQAVLGPIDLQFWHIPARAIVYLSETKPKPRIHDPLLSLARRARRDVLGHHKDALDLMAGVYSSAAANRIAHKLNDGNLTHGYPVTMAAAARLGLKVSGAMPPEPLEIVRAFRRNRSGKRSVVYCT